MLVLSISYLFYSPSKEDVMGMAVSFSNLAEEVRTTPCTGYHVNTYSCRTQ